MTSLSLSEHLAELEEVTQELAGLHREAAQISMAETRGKLEHQQWSEEATVTGRKQYADFQVVDLTADRIKIQGEISALRERKDFLMSALGVLRVRRDS